MKNLQLSLKTKWFEMTKAGIKTEDYREVNEYWVKRLCFNFYYEHNEETPLTFYFDPKPFAQNTMTLGYPKKGDESRIIRFEHAGIEIRTGNPNWGAEEGKLYFVIKHGKKI